MTAHAIHNMHHNSLLAYEKNKRKLRGRKNKIYEFIWFHGPCTDRQVKDGMGLEDMNQVRPRISELVKNGNLIEAGSVQDKKMKSQVRLLKVALSEPEQVEINFL